MRAKLPGPVLLISKTSCLIILPVKKKKFRGHNQPRPIEKPQPPIPHPLEEQSWSASIKSHRLTKWGLIFAVVGVFVTVAGIVIPFTIDRTSSETTAHEKEQNASVVSEATPAASPLLSSNSPTPHSKETAQPAQTKENNVSRNLAAAHIRKARTLYHQRRYQNAVAECNQALQIDPSNREAQTLKVRIERTAQILADNDKSPN